MQRTFQFTAETSCNAQWNYDTFKAQKLSKRKSANKIKTHPMIKWKKRIEILILEKHRARYRAEHRLGSVICELSLFLFLWSVGTFSIPDQSSDLLYILNLCSLPNIAVNVGYAIITGRYIWQYSCKIYLSCLVIGSWPPAAPEPQQSRYSQMYTEVQDIIYMCNIYNTSANNIVLLRLSSNRASIDSQVCF